jgi:hypothetical protein
MRRIVRGERPQEIKGDTKIFEKPSEEFIIEFL